MAIAPSTYYDRHARPVTDAEWADAHAANRVLDYYRLDRSLYGSDKLWSAMRRDGIDIGRDQVARLMGILGIVGITRSKEHRTTTTIADRKAPRHPDLINRAWSTPTRPDQWWVADFTYVWTLRGFCYTSFVTDVYSRRILGWRVSSSKATPLVTSALEQALFTRRRTDARFTSKDLVFIRTRGQSIHSHRVHPGARRCGHRSLDRDSRRRPRQRPHGVDHRFVQDRARKTAQTNLERRG